MIEENKVFELDPDEISLIIDAVSLIPEDFNRLPPGLESEGLEDPFEGNADSIKEKLSNDSAELSAGELQLMYWALCDYLELLNKRKAVARKGTALHKRTHSDLKIINSLLPKFVSLSNVPK